MGNRVGTGPPIQSGRTSTVVTWLGATSASAFVCSYMCLGQEQSQSLGKHAAALRVEVFVVCRPSHDSARKRQRHYAGRVQGLCSSLLGRHL